MCVTLSLYLQMNLRVAVAAAALVLLLHILVSVHCKKYGVEQKQRRYLRKQKNSKLYRSKLQKFSKSEGRM